MTEAMRRPPSVTAAAVLFALYGVAAVVNAAISQDWSGWADTGSAPRALLRIAAALLVAWGLLRGTVWAWWVALPLAILWLISGFAPVLVMDHGDMHWLPPSSNQIFLVVSLTSLSLALGLLLTPTARAFLRRS